MARARPPRGGTAAGSPGTAPRLDVLQVVTILAAVYLLVVGIVGVARGDFLTSGLTEPVVVVGLLSMTPVYGLGIAVVGLLLMYAAGGEEIDDLGIRVLAGIVLVLGIVLVIEPGAFREWLGTEVGDGWHHVLLGALLLGLTFVPPIDLRRPGRHPVPDAGRRTGRPGSPPADDRDATRRIR